MSGEEDSFVGLARDNFNELRRALTEFDVWTDSIANAARRFEEYKEASRARRDRDTDAKPIITAGYTRPTEALQRTMNVSSRASDSRVATSNPRRGGLGVRPQGRPISRIGKLFATWHNAMVPARIHGSQYPLLRIFSNEFAFRIPPYQRPYRWTTEQAGELLDDLLAVVGDNRTEAVGDLDPYFLGSIVLIKDEDRAEAEVVDGQQRLTTLTILLAALRALGSESFASGLEEFLYERGNPVAGTENRYRLTVRSRDESFFKGHVQERGALDKLVALDPHVLTDPRKAMRENAKLFLGRLGAVEEGVRTRLSQFMVQRCFLVAVSTPDLTSAYRIFSVLNERGLDLSHSDILKAEIVGRASAADEEEYTAKWEDAEDALGGERFDDLFAHIRMVFAKTKLRGTVLEEFRSAVVDKFGDSRGLIDEVIIPYSEVLEPVLDANYEASGGADEVNRQLRWLNRIDNADWVPVALSFIVQRKPTATELGTFLVELERLAAYQYIDRVNRTNRIKRYGRLLKELDSGDDLLAAASAMQLTDAEKSAVRTRLDGDVYRETTRLYTLLRLDEALSTGAATYDYKTITVEHVLPQTPAEGSVWKEEFDDDAHTSWVHRLGNLVLLNRRKNSSAQNFEFDTKKIKYFTGRTGVSPFSLTTQVLGESTWTKSVVERRQRDALAKLIVLWRLQPSV